MKVAFLSILMMTCFGYANFISLFNPLLSVCQNLDDVRYAFALAIVIIINSQPSHDRRHYKFHNYYNYIIDTVIETFSVGLQSIRLNVINFVHICHI